MNLKTKAILFGAISSLLYVGISNAASFDCKKAHSFSEKAICKNTQLSLLDDRLAVVFKDAREGTGNTEEFKAIARGNFALRNECKTDACVEKWLNNSINLYEFIYSLSPIKQDSLADYPREVKEACANNTTDREMAGCINAQNNYDEKELEKDYRLALSDPGLPQAQKETLKNFYAQWKKDRDKYCGLLENGGTISYIKIAGCIHSWTQDLADEMQELVMQLDSEDGMKTGLRQYLEEATGNTKKEP